MTHQARTHNVLRGKVNIEWAPQEIVREVFTGEIRIEPEVQIYLPPWHLCRENVMTMSSEGHDPERARSAPSQI